MFGISESPLVTGNMVIASPGGKKASMVAFNINDGKVIWETEPVDNAPQYINPKLIEYAGKKMIINVMGTYILAVDAQNGKVLWKENYAAQHGGVVLLGNNLFASNHMAKYWAHPVIKNGKLYLRHGDVLMVYQIK